MKKIMKLALVTHDKEYATAFTEAFAAAQSGFTVSLVKDAGAPESVDSDVLIVDKEDPDATGAVTEDDCPELALAETGSSFGAAPRSSADRRCAQIEIVAGRGVDPVVVDKYAGCAHICSEVKAAYAMAHGSAGFVSTDGMDGDVCLISVVGVEGGAGASSVALGLAGEFSAYRDKKVLYLNFEAFESPRLGTGGQMASRTDMSRYLFAFFGESIGAGAAAGMSRSTHAAVSAEPYIARDDYGVMRFPPFAGLNRLRELRGAQLGRFMRDVAGETGADMILADWGGGLTDEAAEYIGVSDFVVFVTRHGGAKAPIAGDDPLLQYLADELGVDRSRVIVVVGRSPASESDESSDGGGADAPDGSVEICEDPYAFDRSEERISISLATSFGTGVKKLADIMLETEDDIPENSDAADRLFADVAAEVMV
jgi:hypothetical protein